MWRIKDTPDLSLVSAFADHQLCSRLLFFVVSALFYDAREDRIVKTLQRRRLFRSSGHSHSFAFDHL
jgi:hypothetical protein